MLYEEVRCRRSYQERHRTQTAAVSERVCQPRLERWQANGQGERGEKSL